jgi:medium-chain acyl-[acyl-carrier-protein] hydrolase
MLLASSELKSLDQAMMDGNMQKSNSWITGTKINPQAQMRLFCFPYAGGSAAVFHSWSKHLASVIEVCPVQLPGRGGRIREKPFVRMGPLVPAITENILDLIDKPFAFFGHSMGALIGFEVARQLRSQGLQLPFHLFVSGCEAPTARSTGPFTYNLPEPEFIEELKKLNGTPVEILENPEMMTLLMPLLRADFELVQHYSYTPDLPLPCPITAFGGLQDTQVACENLEEWRQQTTRKFSLHMLAGDHFFLNHNREPILRVIGKQMLQAIP